MFLPHPRVKVSIVGSLRDREVACSASDRQGSNFESCVWRTVSSQSSHHPQEVLLAQFSLVQLMYKYKKISMKLVYQYMAIFFNFSPTSNHLHPLQVENCDSNSRLVVDEDDNDKFRLESVNPFILFKFPPLEIVSRYRDPQLKVRKITHICFIWDKKCASLYVQTLISFLILNWINRPIKRIEIDYCYNNPRSFHSINSDLTW